MPGTVPSSSPQHCMICTKFALNPFGSLTVGVPPVHETEIAWLLRLRVWLTVTARLEKAPRPLTVTCDGVGGRRVSVPWLPAREPPVTGCVTALVGAANNATVTTAAAAAANARGSERTLTIGERIVRSARGPNRWN